MKVASRQVWQVGVGLLISVVFLFLAVRNIHWPDVWTAWRGARVDLLVAGSALLVLGWGVAAVRWRILLAPSPGLRVRDAFAYICIGYLSNTVLPFRLGDLARATLIGRKKDLGISRALGSIALERVLDLLALTGVALVLAWAMEIPPAIQAAGITLAGGALGALVFLVVLAFHQKRLHRITAVLAKVMPHHLADKVMTLIRNFSAGADILRRPMGVVSVCGLSMLGWGLAGLTTWTWIRAFQLPVPWQGAFFVLVVINLGSAIPSSPGYVGVYHYLAVLALSLWVPDRNAALAYAIGTHALNMLLNALLGSFFLAREGLSLQGLKAQVNNGGEDA